MSEITPEQIQRQFKKGADLSEVAELRLFDEKINKINNLNLVPRIKMLNLSYNQIPEIEGLKHCPDLKEINLSHNKITSVSSFAFEKNKAVTTLDLSYNQIDKFAPTSAFLKLQILNIEHNMLSSIEFVGNCKELRILNISSNKLKRIDPVDYLTKLEELNASENLIADISERNFKNHQNLTHLDLSFNHLKSITFIQSIPNITTFNCSNNKVKKVEFTRELPFLENLDLSHNEFPSLASLPKYAPNIVSLDFSDNMMLESLDMELLMDLKELREINFADNFFVTKALEEELHQQYPHLECINDRQFKRPGYYELYEIEKMKEDPEISSFVDSELGDALSRVSANDEYNVAEVRKELESKAMNAKKYENVLTSEKDFKAYMNEYQQLMQKLRIQHQSLVKGKAYLAEPTELSKEVDEELTRETQAREEVKSREVERKSTKAQTLITQSQSDKTSENGERGSYSRGKPDTPTKNLLIRTQKNFRRVEGDGAPVEKEEKKFTKTSIGFGSRAQRNVDIGSTDEILKRLQTEKENFDKLKKKTKTINIKDVMQKNYRSRIISDIRMSETIRDTNGESQNDTE